jgi:hypothetical protein
VAIMVGTVPLMAVRWRWLLRAQGIDDRMTWLTRTYFTSYTAGQVLPTAIGGDAWRVVETSRRHPGRRGDITAIVLLERGLAAPRRSRSGGSASSSPWVATTSARTSGSRASSSSRRS